MPGMSGGELADHLSLLRPDARVLLMSGYSEQKNEIASSSLYLADHRIDKPFTAQALLSKIRKLLDPGKT